MEKLYIVSFYHGGREHRPDSNNRKSWNTGKHLRKFIKNKGTYIDKNNKIQNGEICFWGEWEPESKVAETGNTRRDRVLPKFIHTPYYVVPKSYAGLQNTDPFVFGNKFFYTICRQNSRPSLKSLKKGSIILFGSCIDKKFVLDTVFVVGGTIGTHKKNNYRNILNGKIQSYYNDTVISPLYLRNRNACGNTCNNVNREYRLYFGATYQNPVNKMFSFFPCLPYEQGSKGFARPVIKLDDFITNTQTQGIKLTRNKNEEQTKKIWDRVVEQVRKKSLMLGIYTEVPPKK